MNMNLLNCVVIERMMKMNFKNKKTKDNLIIGSTNSGRQRKLINEMPYTYLKDEIENKNIPERFINSVFK